MSKYPDPHLQLRFINRLTGPAIFVLKHIIPTSSLLEKWRRKNIESTLKNLGDKKGQTLPVERVTNLSKEEFVSKYLKKGIPVIFSQEATDWVCCQKWDFHFFKETFQNEPFSIIDSPGLNEPELTVQAKRLTRKDLTGREFVEAMEDGEPLYIRFCPILETHPYLRKDLNLTWLKKMKECFLGVSYQTFIGSQGRKTPLHSETTSFFYVMIEGKKRWRLYSPSALTLLNPTPEGRGYNHTEFSLNSSHTEQYPGADQLHHYECEVSQGDILFVPTWMWHEVENLTHSWGVSYRFTNLRGFLKYPSLAFIRFFLTKPNFLEVIYYSFFKSDVGKRTKNPLTPKIFLRDKE